MTGVPPRYFEMVRYYFLKARCGLMKKFFHGKEIMFFVDAFVALTVYGYPYRFVLDDLT